MSLITLLPDLPDCSVEQVSQTEEAITIIACSTTSSSHCPDCQQVSSQVHSTYTRSLQTLPREKAVSPRRANAEEYGGLTERERMVATLIGLGKSNAEIGGLLVVSRRTVETYVSRVLSKLGLSSRSQIALWTHDKGLTSREL